MFAGGSAASIAQVLIGARREHSFEELMSIGVGRNADAGRARSRT